MESFVEPQLILSDNSSKTKSSAPRQRSNTLRILIHATMQLLSSPPPSPISPRSPSENIRSSASSTHSTSSSETVSTMSEYISFPEFEAYDDDINNNTQLAGSRGEAESMVVQMEKFDEMLVNGVYVLRSSN